jgi:Ca-activated chloride channel family protein
MIKSYSAPNAESIGLDTQMMFNGLYKSFIWGGVMQRKILVQIIVISVMFVVACGGGGGDSPSAPPSPPAPTLSPQISTPIVLDHQVAVLGNSSSRELSIRNAGTANLDIGQITLAQANAAFSITSDHCSGSRLAPSASCTLVTKLTPADQIDYSNSLLIPSNDTARSPLTVHLSGKGRAYSVNINEVKTDGCSIDPKVLKILVSVTDATGAPVDTLTDANFTVFENGIQKAITNLTHPIINSPVSIALVLDYSMSLSSSDRVTMETAAKSFISLLDPGTDEASIIKFALTIGAKTPFTSDKGALNTAIDAVYPGNTGGTVLYEAAFAAIDDTAARNNDRRAIIILSDGYDEESAFALNVVIARSLEKGIPVFTITYLNSVMPKPEIMQQLAQATGGEAFVATTSADMQSIYSKISTILSHQYLIEFNTSSTGGAPVSVNVKIDDNSDLGENTKVAAGCN